MTTLELPDPALEIKRVKEQRDQLRAEVNALTRRIQFLEQHHDEQHRRLRERYDRLRRAIKDALEGTE